MHYGHALLASVPLTGVRGASSNPSLDPDSDPTSNPDPNSNPALTLTVTLTLTLTLTPTLTLTQRACADAGISTTYASPTRSASGALVGSSVCAPPGPVAPLATTHASSWLGLELGFGFGFGFGFGLGCQA